MRDKFKEERKAKTNAISLFDDENVLWDQTEQPETVETNDKLGTIDEIDKVINSAVDKIEWQKESYRLKCKENGESELSDKSEFCALYQAVSNAYSVRENEELGEKLANIIISTLAMAEHKNIDLLKEVQERLIASRKTEEKLNN